MDIRKRSALTALGLAAFGALAVGSMRRSSPVISDAGVTVTTTTASAAATVDPADVPDPVADYKSIDDAKLDGNKALGKTLFFRVWRGTTDASTVTLYGCGKLAGGLLTATYSIDKRPLVKAIPATIPSQGHCPRVVIKLTKKEPYTNDFKGELQQIMDVTPADVDPLPAGVDYVSMDDVNIDGKKAAGKIAQLRAYRSDLEEKKFTAYPCGRSGGAGLNFLYVTFTPAQKDVVKDFSSSIMTCETIKVKLTTQQAYSSTWNAQMLEVVKE
jgi:hypothetical protein